MTQHISRLRRLDAQVERMITAFEATEAPTDFAGIDRAAKAITALTKAATQVDAAIREAEERVASEPKTRDTAEPEKTLDVRRSSIESELRAIAAECGLDLDELDELDEFEDSLEYLAQDRDTPQPGRR